MIFWGGREGGRERGREAKYIYIWTLQGVSNGLPHTTYIGFHFQVFFSQAHADVEHLDQQHVFCSGGEAWRSSVPFKLHFYRYVMYVTSVSLHLDNFNKLATCGSKRKPQQLCVFVAGGEWLARREDRCLCCSQYATWLQKAPETLQRRLSQYNQTTCPTRVMCGHGTRMVLSGSTRCSARLW